MIYEIAIDLSFSLLCHQTRSQRVLPFRRPSVFFHQAHDRSRMGGSLRASRDKVYVLGAVDPGVSPWSTCQVDKSSTSHGPSGGPRWSDRLQIVVPPELNVEAAYPAGWLVTVGELTHSPHIVSTRLPPSSPRSTASSLLLSTTGTVSLLELPFQPYLSAHSSLSDSTYPYTQRRYQPRPIQYGDEKEGPSEGMSTFPMAGGLSGINILTMNALGDHSR